MTKWSSRGIEVNCKVNWLFNVTINDISVIYVTAHGCAGGLKKMDLRLGSQRHRHLVGFFNVPVLAPTRNQPFYTVITTHHCNLTNKAVGTTSIWRDLSKTPQRRQDPDPLTVWLLIGTPLHLSSLPDSRNISFFDGCLRIFLIY